jgi:hypothetical protein
MPDGLSRAKPVAFWTDSSITVVIASLHAKTGVYDGPDLTAETFRTSIRTVVNSGLGVKRIRDRY